jgi:hypothetical protein
MAEHQPREARSKTRTLRQFVALDAVGATPQKRLN